MPKDLRPSKTKAQGLYDRIADVHNLAMKLNGYSASVAKYLRSLDLSLSPDSLVLDAGSGTGIVTEAFHNAGLPSKRVVSLDLSIKSLEVGRESLMRWRKKIAKNDFVQANVLSMPFADNTFDLLLMCGVLEYTPLDDGLREAARILKPGAPLVFLPVKPSVIGSVLELLYNFKTHSLDSVRQVASNYFDIVGNHKFPITEPIAWSKTIFLLEKK
jgi:ubiquinone/menaquinone biosynthesis C-methylase UbiE